NYDLSKSGTIQIELPDMVGEAMVYTVSGQSGIDLNTEENPKAVQIETTTWDTNSALEIPPLAFSLIAISQA
ncbi:MAG: hypothetical protein AB8G95_17010, partial [Anaerolineae bacterium]